LEGFKTVINKGIRLYVGKNRNLNIQMETSTIREEIVITGKTGAVDVRKTTVGVNITNEMLTSLPTARNPWTILNLVPGMMIDREDVGGNESGQQSAFYGLGASDDDTTWNIDGANITDPSAIGAAPAYLNTNSYEEMQVTMGANDIGAQTGGTQLNFVTKRGGNRYSGDFHLYVEDEQWEMTQTLPQSITDQGLGSPGIFRLYQYGINFGGPIMKDKLWFFGSYCIQDIHSRTIAQSEDATWLLGNYFKVDFQFGNTSGMLQYTYDNKMKWNRTAIGASRQSPDSMWNQSGPGSVYLGSLQQVMGNLMLNAKFCYTDGGFTLDPVGNRDDWMHDMQNGTTGPDWYWYWTPGWYWDGPYCYYTTNRNTMNLSLDGNYFAEGVLGGDHEIRFGVDFYNADTTSQTLYPNHRCLFVYDRKNPGGYKEVWWLTDGIFDVGFKRLSFYLSDTATFGKLTANIGVRYDKETGSHNEATAPALLFGSTPIYTNYLGNLTAPGKDIDADFTVISPRVSLTYDINGDGKNVVKASFARYGGQSGNSLAGLQWTVGVREVDVLWNDKNGDLKLDWGEFSEDFADWYYWSIDPYDPYAVDSPNTFDPDYNSPILTEFTLAFEKAFGDDIALSLNLFYKKTTNIGWSRGMFTVPMTGAPVSYGAGDVETAENWFVAGTYVFNDGTTKDWYERYYTPNATYRTNHSSERYNLYKAIQLIFSKKLAGGWMLDASFTYSDWQRHYDPDEYFDKTNFDFNQDAVVAPSSGGSGITGIYVNSRWQFKMSGLYQLPWGINITGVFQAREGYVVPFYETFKRGSGLSWTNMYEAGKKSGDDRLPTFWMLNLGLEKTFKISDTTTATLFVDGYNITNNTIELAIEPQIGEAKGDIQRILNPGLFQFGVRVSF
jgi:hypothetical protein